MPTFTKTTRIWWRAAEYVPSGTIAFSDASPQSGTPFPLDSILYLQDATTLLYSAARVNNGLLQLSDNQSATIPFTPTWS